MSAMPSGFDYSTQDADPQQWTWTWAPGANLANFFALYDYSKLADSSGDLTVSVATAVASTLDGPIQVAKFHNLTLGATLSASQRCRGFMPLVTGDLVVNSGGGLSMTGLGAKGAANWAIGRDIFVPTSITFTGKNTSLAQFLAWIRSTGYCIFDPTLYACPPPGLGDVQCDWGTWAPFGSPLVSAAGCGPGAIATVRYGTVGTSAGTTGTAGSNAPGGGGAGAAFTANTTTTSIGGAGGDAFPWGGGPGGGGGYSNLSTWLKVLNGVAYCGKGGLGDYGAGAGNPAGDNTSSGVGGVVIVIVQGAVSILSGGIIQADGMPGISGTAGGAGSGGGAACIIYGGAYSNSGTIRANGGAGATTGPGGTGGAGVASAKTITQMGWAA